MKTASEELVREHESILLSLRIIDKIVGQLKDGSEGDIEDITSLIDFLKTFADKCHHGKEEDLLFNALARVGFSKDNGPVGVMLTEHTMGRNFIKQMSDAISSESFDAKAFVFGASGYTKLLRDHIDKENGVLFPMGDGQLSEATQLELIEKFRLHEENVLGGGKHQYYLDLLERLKTKYL